MKQTLMLSGVPQTVMNLIRRPEGASLKDLIEATGWQAHSIRGLISTMRGKGVQIESAHIPGIGRAYKHWDSK